MVRPEEEGGQDRCRLACGELAGPATSPPMGRRRLGVVGFARFTILGLLAFAPASCSKPPTSVAAVAVRVAPAAPPRKPFAVLAKMRAANDWRPQRDSLSSVLYGALA